MKFQAIHNLIALGNIVVLVRHVGWYFLVVAFAVAMISIAITHEISEFTNRWRTRDHTR